MTHEGAVRPAPSGTGVSLRIASADRLPLIVHGRFLAARRGAAASRTSDRAGRYYGEPRRLGPGSDDLSDAIGARGSAIGSSGQTGRRTLVNSSGV